ncbi:MAG TPA: hypothetical protein VFT22_00940 [Kofleriaceae bacterium]|nr:hypothetical protein [Kofleriaceae bacterium]
MARWVAWLVLTAGCTHAQASRARLAGEVAALGGVAGIIAGVLATSVTPQGKQIVTGFSILSGAGIVTYAVGELEDPASDGPVETLAQRNHRWAKILTERAAGAAREGKCARVRRLEIRVRRYDPDVHDFVLLRDPEVLRCLQSPPAPDETSPAGSAAAPPAPAPDETSPAGSDPR